MLNFAVMTGQLVRDNTDFEAAFDIPNALGITRHVKKLRSQFEEIDKTWPALRAQLK